MFEQAGGRRYTHRLYWSAVGWWLVGGGDSLPSLPLVYHRVVGGLVYIGRRPVKQQLGLRGFEPPRPNHFHSPPVV